MKTALTSLVQHAWSASVRHTRADSPWIGTWKLDAAQDQFTGDTFTLTNEPGDMLHFFDGSTPSSYVFGIDGKARKRRGGTA